ncbi:MAG: CTP-dependent riboflavin kinase [Candidatus Micrarchaeota archaeon]|nr:CTP-dependent riboflavin kinase [Candidatus Micrarchaeota archaeon]
MDELLLLLAKKGALRTPIRLTTVELGSLMGMSQQNASVRLRELGEEGLIERSRGLLRITPYGAAALKEQFLSLKKIFEPGLMLLRGRVVEGLREGKFYMSLPGYRGQIERKLGFLPYAGTLNLELLPEFVEKRVELRSMKPVRIRGFECKGKSYGPIDAYPCRVGGIDGVVIFPRRSHHGLSVIEIIAPVYLMGELRLRKGSELEVEVLPR